MDIVKVFFFLLCFMSFKYYGCEQSNLNDCFKNELSKLLKIDNEAKLHSSQEILIIVNFLNEGNSDFKAAVIPKSVFPKYLIGKSNIEAKGYIKHENVLVIFYGYPPDFLQLKNVKDNMTFTEPFQMKQPDEGNPPFPPLLIEPLIYSFTKENDCFIQTNKTVATTLFE